MVNPVKLHNDIKTLLQQTQKKVHGVIGECWYFLSVIQNKFPSHISPAEKKEVQRVSFLELKAYVAKDSNLNTMAALLKALGKSLKENYLDDTTLAELYKYVSTLSIPLKATFAVPVAALEVLESRMELF